MIYLYFNIRSLQKERFYIVITLERKDVLSIGKIKFYVFPVVLHILPVSNLIFFTFTHKCQKGETFLTHCNKVSGVDQNGRQTESCTLDPTWHQTHMHIHIF